MLEQKFTQAEFTRRFKQPPAWRQEAVHAFQRLPLPSPKNESWRYTDLNGVDFTGIEPLAKTKPVFKEENVQIQTIDADDSFGTAPPDKLSAWTQAFGDAVQISVPAGQKARLESTLKLSKSGATLQSVHVGAGSQLDFFEHYTSADTSLLFGQKTVFHIGQNACLRYYAVQRLGMQTLCFAEREFHLAEQSRANCFNADFGSALSRTTFEHHFDGNSSKSNVEAVFFSNSSQHFDLTTRAMHYGQGTQSTVRVKGVLKDKASSVYRGLIRIDSTARKTDSFLQNRVLHLNSGVKSNTVPSLFIDNNDVKASHSAAVSKLNDDSLFYMRSRGLNKAKAKELVVQGFLDDVVQKLPHEGLLKKIHHDIETKIEKRAK